MARNPDWFLFNKIFESYDKLKFQKEPCDRLVVHAGIREGERVLDVACGTGWATLAAAHAVEQTGRLSGSILPTRPSKSRVAKLKTRILRIQFRRARRTSP